MARFDISLLGDAELTQKLQGLPEKLERKVIRQAIRKGGQPIVRDAKAQANKLTGAMAKSIKLRAMKRKKGRIGVRIQTGTRGELGIAADDPYYYPAIVEFGDGETHHPYRFMRGALERNQQQSLTVIRDAIAQGIEREAASNTV